MKLWEKGEKTDGFIASFTVGNDYLLDGKLAKYDAIASIAHAACLQKAGIISFQEFKKLKAELKKIAKLAVKGRFKVLPGQEDCHTAIENHLCKKLGALGKKIHAGRSRNDQCIAMLRLYTKEKLLETEIATIALCKEMLGFAKKHEFVPMPGYTHSRKAMPSSVGLWAASFVELLLDSLQLLEAASIVNDQSPLGAAAGFGSSLSLDRKLSAKLLGFGRVQNNVLCVQSSRGKFESIAISALSQVMLDLEKLSNDLILFSTHEFGFFVLPNEICTGSSIMPQKQNPDVLELVRAKSKKVQAALFQALSISSSVGSSYHRDLQLTKQPLIESFEETVASLKAMQIVFSKLNANKQDCIKACSSELFAADIAIGLSKQGIPFREAYKEVAKGLGKIGNRDVVENIKGKKIQGATGNLGLKRLGKIIDSWAKKANKKLKQHKKVLGLFYDPKGKA